MKLNPNSWREIEWPFDSVFAAKCKEKGIKILEAKCGRGRIILRDEKHFHFVANFGNHSERSYSGCLYGMGVHTLEQAKAKLENMEF